MISSTGKNYTGSVLFSQDYNPLSFSVLLFLFCLTDDPADGYNQVPDVKRLLNIGIEPLPDGLLAVRVPRHCNEGNLRVARLHFLEERPSLPFST